MMVVGHFPCSERLFVCVYAMTQDIASASDFGKYSEPMHGPSLWSGGVAVSSACSARAEEFLSPVYMVGIYTLETEIPPPWQNCCAKSLFSAMGYILRRYGSSGAVITKKQQKMYINY